MARWTPDARMRLARAALDLYTERGFESTTVAEIAARAGLTERTYFRHFADKREVLFVRSAALEAHIIEAVSGASETGVMDAIVTGLCAAGDFFKDSRDWSQRRQQIINTNAGLQERELIKMDSLRAALSDALEQRGVSRGEALLAAEVGLVVFRQAFEQWISEPNPYDWTVTVQRVREQLHSVLTRSAPF
jgi:AcrR family transcriptional regulator